MNTTMANVLEKAADLLESGEMGWCQHFPYKYREVNGVLDVSKPAAACSAGLLALASGPLGNHAEKEAALTAADDASVKRHNMGLVRWNDNPHRTKEEVIDFFKQVAKDLRNEATPA